jgi:Phosphotransferase enzyme family
MSAGRELRARRGAVSMLIVPGRRPPPRPGRAWDAPRVEEIALSGGNMTPVVRVGDTVRRAAGPWTPTVHELLRHVRAAGFDLGPEPLGIDEHGREILSFVPGEVAVYPLPDFVLADATLVRVARALRAYHDATVDLVDLPGAVWRWPAHAPAEVICHNDFAPYNMAFADGELTGVIDFDLASPGPRVWDMAYTAYRFVPLSDPGNPDVAYPGEGAQARRLARFCAEYGAEPIGPREVTDAAVARLRALVDFIVRSAAAGDAAQQAVLARGDVVIYERDIAYLESHRDGLAPSRA